MFKTLRSKILAIIILMLAFLMFASVFHVYFARMNTKQLMVQNYKFSITASSFVQEIKNRIITSEDCLKSLSLIGSLYYKTDRSNDLTDRVIEKVFKNYPQALGGGIWFKPYIIDKSRKYNCFYAFRDKNNKIVIDRNFESEKYDYPNQEWYKQIISQVTPEGNIVWSKPYYENMGSYTMMVTVGTGIYVDGKLVGIVTVDWELDSIINEVSKMKPVEKTFSMYKSGKEIKNSFALFGNVKDDFIIATTDPYLDNKTITGHSLKEIPWYTSADKLYATTYITYHKKKYIPFVNKLDNGMVLIICLPKSEMFKDVNNFYFLLILTMLGIALLIPALLYYSLNRYIINPIDKLTKIAHKIGKGEDIQIKIEKPEEFAHLASTFDKMTKDIKLITNERAKITSELSVAKSIQSSSLPNVFPPFPNKNEFDIYASMEPAKEVGGDFYDFFFIDKTKFMFLIADVSGKGIPAALFMMTVKTLINNIAQLNYSPKQLIEIINNKICQTNKQGFFVTVLLGITDINTGETSIINCGHNLPLIKRKDGNFEYLQLESNIALGVFEDSKFEVYETVMNVGDIIFTYTDGVTEAINKNDEVYGETRLYDCLNSIDTPEPIEIVQRVKTSINEYSDSNLQSDDITMLVFKYNGRNNTKIFKETAKQENYKQFYNWLHTACDEWCINEELSNKLDMSAEEIFANIAFYAYREKAGMLEATLTKSDENIIFKFIDEGIEYNPLEKPDPNIDLPPEERPLGGLGVYMVKNMADELFYKRENGKNILTLVFKL
ncbi:SpoIIE family protein phosphatase [bacterium]|nr:SpoIIE family protein phosphatase [bacterium]